MYGGKNILLDHTLVEHDGVLIVVTLPRHEGNLEVATQGEFTILGGVTLGEDVATGDALSARTDGTEVDGCRLVGFAPLRYAVFLDGILEGYEFLLVGAVVTDADCCRVYELDDTVTLGHNLGTGVADKLSFDTCTDNGSLGTHQRHGLAHHVRTHQRTVRVVVFEEGDERSRD